MSAVSLLCEIIAHCGKVSSDFHRSDAGFAFLVRHGFLREAGAMSSVVCDQCDDPHSARVVYEDGSNGYNCPELGFVQLAPVYSTAFLPDLTQLVERLAEVFACRQRKSSSLHGQTWRIGAVSTASEPVMLYFHPSLGSDDDALDLQDALRREARSEWRLVVTAGGGFPIAGFRTVPLDDLVEVDAESGALCPIADPGVLAGVPRKNAGGRPTQHGDMISRIIEERIANGQALKGRNKEADAVLGLFAQRNPKEKLPSISSVRDYVTKIRTGQ